MEGGGRGDGSEGRITCTDTRGTERGGAPPIRAGEGDAWLGVDISSKELLRARKVWAPCHDGSALRAFLRRKHSPVKCGLMPTVPGFQRLTLGMGVHCT